MKLLGDEMHDIVRRMTQMPTMVKESPTSNPALFNIKVKYGESSLWTRIDLEKPLDEDAVEGRKGKEKEASEEESSASDSE